MKLRKITKTLSRKLAELRFEEPVAHVYDPLQYAWRAHEEYLRRFGAKRGRTVLLGMNPGPWGMAQTGVPFGEVAAVRDWIGIETKIDKPRDEHPKRPVHGFACTRSEVSGRRLWTWARERYASPEKFFDRFFVLNYCPLIFLEDGGRNRTPDKLAKNERDAVFAICDEALRAFVHELDPAMLIGVGAFAEARAKSTLGESHRDLPIARVLHPSPASPIANRGWAAQAERELESLGVL